MAASACIPVSGTTLCTIAAGVEIEVRHSPLPCPHVLQISAGTCAWFFHFAVLSAFVLVRWSGHARVRFTAARGRRSRCTPRSRRVPARRRAWTRAARCASCSPTRRRRRWRSCRRCRPPARHCYTAATQVEAREEVKLLTRFSVQKASGYLLSTAKRRGQTCSVRTAPAR